MYFMQLALTDDPRFDLVFRLTRRHANNWDNAPVEGKSSTYARADMTGNKRGFVGTGPSYRGEAVFRFFAAIPTTKLSNTLQVGCKVE